MTEKYYPVVIVGGGIVGLNASLLLSSHKIKHLLVERHATTSIHPRARGVNMRTMEIFRSLQIDEAVEEAGAKLAPSAGIYQGRSLVEVIEPKKRKEGLRGQPPFANLLDSVSPTKGVRCTQDMMEPVLVKIARERAGELRYNTSCEGFEQDDNGVTVTLRDRAKDTTSTIHADYLVAADGANSPIRKKLGISTTGKGPLGNLINILFHADLRDLVHGRELSICKIKRPEQLGFITAIDNDQVWTYHLCWDPTTESAEKYTPTHCEELLRLAIGIPNLNIAVKSIMPWQPSDISATKNHIGRIFLAGDAAHQTTPYAGQGATTGIADVQNLAWKLSLVLKGQASPSLLDTYETERLPVGQWVAKESGEVADDKGLPDTTYGPLSFALKAAFRLNMYPGFGYRYASVGIIPESNPPSSSFHSFITSFPYMAWLTSWFSIPWTIPSLVYSLHGEPGTRAPHIWVHDHTSSSSSSSFFDTSNNGNNPFTARRISTLDLPSRNNHFVLLAGSEGRTWVHAAKQAGTNLSVEIDAYVVGPTGEMGDERRLWDVAAGVGRRGALLIRPDAFVAWRARDSDHLSHEDREGEKEGSVVVLEEVMRRVLCR